MPLLFLGRGRFFRLLVFPFFEREEISPCFGPFLLLGRDESGGQVRDAAVDAVPLKNKKGKGGRGKRRRATPDYFTSFLVSILIWILI